MIGGTGFIALEPADSRRIRRGGVVIWARRGVEGWRLLSVQACQMISVSAGQRPPGADTLLVSPPIADGRRRREVARTVEQAAFCTPVLFAAE